MRRRTATAALCTALLFTAVASGAAVASGPHEGPYDGPPPEQGRRADRQRAAVPLGGDEITFTFDAHLAAEHDDDPLEATGTFEFSHYLNGAGTRAEVAVDCLLTGGDVAVVSGVVTDSDLPGAEGRRVGVTVHDLGRHDRLGYSWAATGSPALGGEPPRCVSSAPFEKVRKGTGDFDVVPWRPRL
ncbi:Repetin [Streptomyces sp. NPDC006349]|uniref:Repetin n=1 Tax=Streptomyces sp. NPDC006349 TaxID=3156757 RepID=UPI0033AD515D